MSLWINSGGREGRRTPTLTSGVGLASGPGAVRTGGQDSGWHGKWRTQEAEPASLRTEAQESLAQGIAGYLTRNIPSFSLSLGSGSEQAVLEGSTSFLLSPPRLHSSSQTSASNLSLCLPARLHTKPRGVRVRACLQVLDGEEEKEGSG